MHEFTLVGDEAYFSEIRFLFTILSKDFIPLAASSVKNTYRRAAVLKGSNAKKLWA